MKNVAIFLWQQFGFAVLSTDNVGGFAGREQSVIGFAEDFVAEANDAVFGFGDARANAEDFVIACRMVVTALHIGDDDLAIVFKFHTLVFDTKSSHQLDAADFEPDEVVRVIDDAHLVGFDVTHAHTRIVKSLHSDGLVLSLPDGFAFFEERREAFLEVRSAADAGVFKDGALEVRVNGSRGGGSEQALGAR